METYGIPEAARLLELPPPAVRTMIEDGALEARQVDGRWRVTRYAVERARVRLQPGPRPEEHADMPLGKAGRADIADRLAALEERLDRLEAADGQREPEPMRPVLAGRFRPED